MYKRHILQLLVCLLALIPIGTRAQQLTGYEYWFDGDLSTIVEKSLSGSKADIEISINTQHLSDGLHTLNFRVKQSDGRYSPVTSSVFFKHNVEEGNQIEYWFDDRYEDRATIDLPSSALEDLVDMTFDMQDNEKFPIGLHQLNIRMATEGKSLNSVYSAWVLKLASGEPNIIEYWVDDNNDKEHRRTVTGHKASSENSHDYVFVNPFDLSGVSPGLHRIYYRATSESGVTNSAVYMTTVTVGCGTTPTLEYWIDDDGSTLATISGHDPSSGDKGTIFSQTLDLSKVSPGAHRLNYRAVDAKGIAQTAISSTPILVKSKYNVENPEALTVTKQAYWFDNEEPKVEYVAPTKNVVNRDYKLDTRNLSDGNHTLHVQYGNSAGIWNGPVDYSFTKIKVDDPVIEANASVENGIVTVKFNSVPYGFIYSLIRQYPTGTIRKANDVKSTEYPAALQLIDTPAPGGYTYYVEGRYTDTDGKTQRVRSGDISVTIDKAAETVKRGRIHGALKINGEIITYPWWPGYYTVYINGERATDSKYPFIKENYGHFRIDDVPYGTELSIGVGYHDGHLSSKLITFVVSENTNNSTYYFDCTEDGEDGFLADNDAYDLVMWEDVHLTPNAWELAIQNKSEYRSWSGKILVKVISKEAFEMYKKQTNGELSSMYFLLHPKAVYYEPSYITSAEAHVKLDKHEYKTLVLDILDMPKSNKSEDYYVCVYSQKDEEEVMKEVGDNPQTIEFNPYDFETAVMNGFKSYMKVYTDVMKLFKEFSAWGDPLKLAWGSLTDEDFNLWVKNFEKGQADGGELLEDQISVGLKSTGMLLNLFFEDMHKAIKKYTDSFKNTNAYEITENVSKVYNAIKGTIDASKNDENLKFFELAKQLLKTAKSFKLLDDPVLGLYISYFECGSAMAKAVEGLSNINSGHYVWDRLARGNGIYKIKVRKYLVNEKRKEYFHGEDFYPHKGGKYNSIIRHSGQIESITIELVNPTNRSIKTTSLPLNDNNVILDEEGITIKNVDFDNEKDFYTDCEAWMTIKWKNKRVTRVPLLDKNFVKIENLSKDFSVPLIMTLELQSEVYMNFEGIPNKLTFVEP